MNRFQLYWPCQNSYGLSDFNRHADFVCYERLKVSATQPCLKPILIALSFTQLSELSKYQTVAWDGISIVPISRHPAWLEEDRDYKRFVSSNPMADCLALDKVLSGQAESALTEYVDTALGVFSFFFISLLPSVIQGDHIYIT